MTRVTFPVRSAAVSGGAPPGFGSGAFSCPAHTRAEQRGLPGTATGRGHGVRSKDGSQVGPQGCSQDTHQAGSQGSPHRYSAPGDAPGQDRSERGDTTPVKAGQPGCLHRPSSDRGGREQVDWGCPVPAEATSPQTPLQQRWMSWGWPGRRHDGCAAVIPWWTIVGLGALALVIGIGNRRRPRRSVPPAQPPTTWPYIDPPGGSSSPPMPPQFPPQRPSAPPGAFPRHEPWPTNRGFRTPPPNVPARPRAPMPPPTSARGLGVPGQPEHRARRRQSLRLTVALECPDGALTCWYGLCCLSLDPPREFM